MNLERYKKNPWAFMTECCYTLDQVDQENPIKLIPQHDYLKYYTELWQHDRFIAVPKSRRMTISWTNMALILWDVLFHRGKFWAAVSKKEDDAGELIDRIEFIYNHIPENKYPKDMLPKIERTVKPPVLRFPEYDSQVQGFPMGADQLRQFTFSGIFGDECAFWPDAQQFYSAAKPTTDGGGKMVLVSSAAPGFFHRLVFDSLDTEGSVDEVVSNPFRPMPGVRMWANKKNGFTVYEIHYSANPDKGEKFARTVENSIGKRAFKQEYEIQWATFEGLPVYGDFSPDFHLTTNTLEPQMGLPLLCGWDFGLTPACVVGQLQEDQLVILREFTALGKPIETFCPEVIEQLAILYPEWSDQDKDFRHYIDPAGTFRKDTDSNTCAKIMYSKGLRRIIPGDVNWEARKNAVEYFLLKRTKKGPAIIMNEKYCPKIARGFRGGYRYPDSAGAIEPHQLRPIKDEFSHPHDALQYICGGVKKILHGVRTVDIPSPQYSFSHSTKVDKGDTANGFRKLYRY